MSQTESLGGADASRWVAVAASLVEYLQSWVEAPEPPEIPRGIFAGARRFLNQVLEGVALDRHERIQPQIPIMVGITNLTIALGILRRLTPPLGSKEAEAKVRLYLACLQAIEDRKDRSPALMEQARALKDFFRELQDEGNRARHAAFARAESPRG